MADFMNMIMDDFSKLWSEFAQIIDITMEKKETAIANVPKRAEILRKNVSSKQRHYCDSGGNLTA